MTRIRKNWKIKKKGGRVICAPRAKHGIVPFDLFRFKSQVAFPFVGKKKKEKKVGKGWLCLPSTLSILYSLTSALDQDQTSMGNLWDDHRYLRYYSGHTERYPVTLVFSIVLKLVVVN